MLYVQPKNLLDFLKDINLMKDGTIYNEQFDLKNLPESPYSKPEPKVSQAAVDVQEVLTSTNNFGNAASQYKSDLITRINETQIKYKSIGLYNLIQAILLETFTLITIEDLAPEAALYFTNEDANRLYTNISYVANVIVKSTTDDLTLEPSKRFTLTQDLRRLQKDTAFMYRTISGRTVVEYEL